MPVWVEVFIVVATIALVVQTLVIFSTLLLLRPIVLRFAEIVSEFQTKLNPILSSTTRILADSEERIRSIMQDASEITHLARGEAQRVDRVVTDAVERIRLQVIRADQIVTGTLAALEETGTKLRKTVWAPVNQFSALLKGIKVGLDVIRGNHRHNSEAATQDEELFI